MLLSVTGAFRCVIGCILPHCTPIFEHPQMVFWNSEGLLAVNEVLLHYSLSIADGYNNHIGEMVSPHGRYCYRR